MNKQIASSIVLAAASAMLGAYGYYELAHKPSQRTGKHGSVVADPAKRLADWAYIAKEKELATGETLRLVIIPHSSGLDFMDVKCFLYTHREFQKAQLSCPDAKQLDIEEP